MSLSAKELALFYGAKCLITYQSDESQYYTESYWEETIVTIDGDILNAVDEGHMEVKPILRPLEGKINALHVEEIFARNRIEEDLEFLDDVGYDNVIERHRWDLWQNTSGFFYHLIRNRYDVFGWIEDDKAISAHTLTQNPYRDE